MIENIKKRKSNCTGYSLRRDCPLGEALERVVEIGEKNGRKEKVQNAKEFKILRTCVLIE